MPILLPSFIRSLIPASNSNSQNSQNHPSSGSVSDQDSDIIPPGTVTIQQQTFNGEQIPTTITEPLNMEQPITELSSMKPLNAEPPKTEEPFPPVVAQGPMEIITPAADDASTAPVPAVKTETGAVKRSQSKRLSKNPGPGPGASKKKNSTEAYNAFWRKLIGITPKGGDKGKGKGRDRRGGEGRGFE